MAKKKIIDLRDMDLFFEDSKQTIKLIDFKTSTLTLNTEIYEKNIFIIKREMVYAHLPKKLKSILNKFF